ncbi:unnamed protein product [marine sediment metagenome]|uniref:Uncharacterized protein n=1 Tax=marine sediment metagenome TaxID=412755 RepID=X1VYP5_9ZZZZ
MMAEKEKVKTIIRPLSAVPSAELRSVRELIDLETDKALIKGELDYASELQEAKRRITQEIKKPRPESTYIKFMGTCMLGGEGDPKEKMKACAAEWGKKSKKEKDALKTSAP